MSRDGSMTSQSRPTHVTFTDYDVSICRYSVATFRQRIGKANRFNNASNRVCCQMSLSYISSHHFLVSLCYVITCTLVLYHNSESYSHSPRNSSCSAVEKKSRVASYSFCKYVYPVTKSRQKVRRHRVLYPHAVYIIFTQTLMTLNIYSKSSRVKLYFHIIVRQLQHLRSGGRTSRWGPHVCSGASCYV